MPRLYCAASISSISSGCWFIATQTGRGLVFDALTLWHDPSPIYKVLRYVCLLNFYVPIGPLLHNLPTQTTISWRDCRKEKRVLNKCPLRLSKSRQQLKFLSSLPPPSFYKTVICHSFHPIFQPCGSSSTISSKAVTLARKPISLC
jgi:hypothetical protein